MRPRIAEQKSRQGVKNSSMHAYCLRMINCLDATIIITLVDRLSIFWRDAPGPLAGFLNTDPG
jgi:hypothetical protein